MTSIMNSVSAAGTIACVLGIGGCTTSTVTVIGDSLSHSLAGAWRADVQFESGDYAAIKDLQFLYIFHADGMMIESSNYDSAPPVPPAYGVWKPAARAGEFEAKYVFFMTRPPANFEELTKAGWSPAGSGVLTERLRLNPAGDAFTSTITLETYDQAGTNQATAKATGKGRRITFESKP